MESDSLRQREPCINCCCCYSAVQAMPLVAERKLDTAVTVPVYNTNSDSVTGSHAVSKERALCPGELRTSSVLANRPSGVICLFMYNAGSLTAEQLACSPPPWGRSTRARQPA